jgi:hypothetical protein
MKTKHYTLTFDEKNTMHFEFATPLVALTAAY